MRNPINFKFDANWAKEDECRKIIEESWDTVFQGNTASQWAQKLQKCSALLVEWHKKSGGNNWWLINQCLSELEEIQKGGDTGRKNCLSGVHFVI